MSKYILCVIYVIFSVSGLTFIKMGSNQEIQNQIYFPIINMSISILSIIGMVCYLISFLLYLGIISKFDLGIIIPLLGGIVNVLILVVSYTVLKERMTLNALAGATIVIVGIFVMNIRK